jgi:hypothetical protein
METDLDRELRRIRYVVAGGLGHPPFVGRVSSSSTTGDSGEAVTWRLRQDSQQEYFSIWSLEEIISRRALRGQLEQEHCTDGARVKTTASVSTLANLRNASSA